MMDVKATKEHAWLNKFVGEWAYEGRAEMGPETPPMEFSGKETVRRVGEFWVQGVGTGCGPGGETATMHICVGYDPAKGEYVGSWFGSMMPNMFVYRGWVENEGKTLVLETKGTCPMNPDETRMFRDITDFVSDDHRHFHTEKQNDDGTWSTMMHMDFKRVK